MSETLNIEGIGTVELTSTERGTGKPVLLLHGGAGPMSVAAWAGLLAGGHPVRVITPTHPGFGGTTRPPSVASIGALARVYEAFLAKQGLTDVTVIGNSVGGWIAAELALLAPSRVSRLVLVDATGIEVEGHPVANPFTIPFEELSKMSYHDPARFRIDPTKFTPEQKAMMAGNFASLKVYVGDGADSSLRGRLESLKAPALVVWGESDRVVDPEYGRAYAQAIPGARFELFEKTGHLPQIESPERLAEAVGQFISGQATRSA